MTSSFTGGHGGAGGRNNSGAYGGGGDGGTGLVLVNLTQNSKTYASTAVVGSGLSSTGGYGGKGSGGSAGGKGIYLLDTIAGDTVTNNGTITGGAGGANTSGVGGTGGAGVAFSATGSGFAATLTNAVGGKIAGGTGGAGVRGASLTVIDAGTIAGGAGTTPGDAITFTGGTNILALGGSDETTTAGATNGFTGAIDIQAGTLTFQQSVGNASNPSVKTTSTFGINVTVGDTIIGSGAVIKAESGTLTFTAADTYTGGTTISAGFLQLGSGTTNGSVSGAIVDNAVLTLDPNGSQTFANAISGTGSLRKLGTGTAVLSNADTYSGGTTISAGTLDLGAATSAGTGAIAFGTLAGTAKARRWRLRRPRSPPARPPSPTRCRASTAAACST